MRPGPECGSVLIIVLWVAFGLVSIALYFAHSMSLELRAADNRTADIEAEQAIAGAARYVSNILANAQDKGVLPDVLSYRNEAVSLGDATFWLIGRSDKQTILGQPGFGLVDEASKLNLNTATLDMLQTLPRITPELAAAIIDWRDADDNVTQGGAESETYLRRNPAYKCKNAPFESVGELRLVLGADLDIIYGEDANLNGVLDLNENDSDISTPSDNRDGRLDPGLFEYVTVYSKPSSVGTNVNNQPQLTALMQNTFGADRAKAILPATGPLPGAPFRSVLQFYMSVSNRITREEFVQIEGYLTAGQTNFVNVNTASEAVLACIPGIGTDKASSLVAYRQSNPDKLNTVAWVTEVLDGQSLQSAAPYLTGRSYQFTADIAAVGHHGRGYRRVKFVFDTSSGTPQIVYRQDLTHLGWALGQQTRQLLLAAKDTR